MNCVTGIAAATGLRDCRILDRGVEAGSGKLNDIIKLAREQMGDQVW